MTEACKCHRTVSSYTVGSRIIISYCPECRREKGRSFVPQDDTLDEVECCHWPSASAVTSNQTQPVGSLHRTVYTSP